MASGIGSRSAPRTGVRRDDLEKKRLAELQQRPPDPTKSARTFSGARRRRRGRAVRRRSTSPGVGAHGRLVEGDGPSARRRSSATSRCARSHRPIWPSTRTSTRSRPRAQDGQLRALGAAAAAETRQAVVSIRRGLQAAQEHQAAGRSGVNRRRAGATVRGGEDPSRPGSSRTWRRPSTSSAACARVKSKRSSGSTSPWTSDVSRSGGRRRRQGGEIRRSTTRASRRSRELHARAERLGFASVTISSFPWHGQHQRLDPTRPMTSWRTAWRSLRKAAGLPHVRFHDGRHTALTRLAEKGVRRLGDPRAVRSRLAGHDGCLQPRAEEGARRSGEGARA